MNIYQPQPLSSVSLEHLKQTAMFFDARARASTWAARSYRALLAKAYNNLIPSDASILEIGCGDGELLRLIHARRKTGIDLSSDQIARAREKNPDATFHHQAGEQLVLDGTYDVIILSDTLNFAADVQQLLERLHTVATPQTRLITNFHNNLWRPVFATAEALQLRSKQPPSSWLSKYDVSNLLMLSAWESIKTQPKLLWPIKTLLLEPFLNRFVAPLLPWACSSVFTIARPKPRTDGKPQSVSVVIPARNEAGNIEAAVLRTPAMGSWTELIFVEGASTDNTWDEIKRVQAKYADRRITIMQQSGRGKGNAVRDGFAIASGDILMILDADLTMPPEALAKFYDALVSQRAEFANGCRLVYPMQKEAMQFLNMLANHFFGHAFSWLLGQRLKDTLCGTKVLSNANYLKIAANRSYFGDFDPFGDFDLIFGADKLSLQIIDVPIRYAERSYGSTNIQRWRHGLLLLRMLVFAAHKIKFK